MFTPYDWQEGIGNRAQYIEGKLAQGAPVLAVSLEEGLLIYTYRRQSRKIFEIYDRLVFAGIGQQSDIEAVRMAALEFASKEGFNRSEEDVTIQRVVTALSAPMKKAFSDFSSSPVVARSLFCEVGASVGEDLFYVLDYDGDYAAFRRSALVTGATEAPESVLEKLGSITATSVESAMAELDTIWQSMTDPEERHRDDDARKGLNVEAVLLERSNARDNRFRLLTAEDI